MSVKDEEVAPTISANTVRLIYRLPLRTRNCQDIQVQSAKWALPDFSPVP